MARFDFYEYQSVSRFVVDDQSDLLDDLDTWVVVPLLLSSDAPKPAKFLNPIFVIDGIEYVFMHQFLSAVSTNSLTNQLGSFKHYSDEITRALDMVFQGY